MSYAADLTNLVILLSCGWIGNHLRVLHHVASRVEQGVERQRYVNRPLRVMRRLAEGVITL
jgi:hypothetical protein